MQDFLQEGVAPQAALRERMVVGDHPPEPVNAATSETGSGRGRRTPGHAAA
jgi:hypothetical protein